MLLATKIISFIIAAMPTILKIIGLIQTAATELKDKTGEEKRAYVMLKIKEILPQLTSDEAYNWINSLVHMLRNMGMKT